MLDSQIGPYGENTAAMADRVRSNASNIKIGDNPDYYCADFLNLYPQFGNTCTSLSVDITALSNQFTADTNITAGSLIVDTTLNIPDGTYVVDISHPTTDTTLVTMSNNATGTGTIDIKIYSMLVPADLLYLYIQLAGASIKQARWHSYWKTAIGWFIAHFLTLYLQGTVNAGSSAAQVIAAAQSRGIVSSKTVGPVSTSYDFNAIAQDLNGWASWKLTIYGQQLATIGRMLSKGGMIV